MKNLFERILRESNYGEKQSIIRVKDVNKPLKRIVKPIDMMYSNDKIIMSNGMEFIVEDRIYKTEKNSEEHGKIFTISNEVFETDDPSIAVRRIYDSFTETETIILIDNVYN